MLGNDLVQAAIKSLVDSITEIDDITTDVREANYQGSDYSFPHLRIQINSNEPIEPRDGNERSEISWEIIAESEQGSSLQCSQLASAVANGLKRKLLRTIDVRSSPIRILDINRPTPIGQRGWRSRVFCEANVIANWNPSQLSNLKFWSAADKIIGLVEADTVQNWRDLSGLKNHLSQGTLANRPIYRASGPNSKPYLEFDGSNDFMRTDSSKPDLQLQNGTIFVVCRVDSGNELGIIQYLNNYGTGRNGWWMGHRSQGSIAWMLANNTSFQEQFNTGVFTQDVWFIAELVISPTAITYLLNGTSQASATRTLTTPTYVAGDRMEIGRRDNAGGGTYSDIDIAEITVFNEAKSIVERSRTRRYLGEKYGITVV